VPEETPRAEATTPLASPSSQESPTSNPENLGRFKSEAARARSLANLKPPRRPGDGPINPANPGGRPKKDGPATRELRSLLSKRFPGDPQNRTYLKLAVESLVKQAIKGNVFAQQLLWERLEGRMPMPVEGDLPAVINVIIERNKPRFPEIELSKDRLLIDAKAGNGRGND
jgi:hypothetical protein